MRGFSIPHSIPNNRATMGESGSSSDVTDSGNAMQVGVHASTADLAAAALAASQAAAAQQCASDAAASAAHAQASAASALQSLNLLKAAILLGSVSPDVSSELAYQTQHSNIHVIQGYSLPAEPAAYKAGIIALANQLTLELQAGTISQATFNQAIAQLGQ